MSSTTVAQHTTQPLNFGPEWLRALSTPDATTPMPPPGGTNSGNVFKFSATKYRYSKDEILALRANVTERLAEDIRNEILENLKDVESVFRPNIIEPLALTAHTSEETAKMSSSSSYISGRTPGGGGGSRGGHSAQQSQQQQSQDSRNRGGSSVSNGRGVSGGGSRGRGGRENTYGPNRGNNNGDDTGENGDDTLAPASSSSWSRGGGFHSRGGSSGSAGGGSFGNRVRSYDDREQSQSFRRGGGGGGTRQTSEGWRRSRGDDDETTDQNEDSIPANAPTSWASRGGGPARRGGAVGGGSMENRTKSNEKWNYNDDRPGPSTNYESTQSRGSGGWRTNPNTSDRDPNARRPQAKRDRMPEWMDDNNEGGGQLIGATFDQDGTFTGSQSTRSNNNNSNEQQKLKIQSSSEDIPAHAANVATDDGTVKNVSHSVRLKAPSKPHEETKPEKSTPPRTDTAVANVPTVSEAIVSKTIPSKQQSMRTWDDEFEPSEVATTVVESTLAEDRDYSSHISTHPIPMEPTPPVLPIIPRPQRLKPAPAPAPAPSAIIDDKQWFYKDPQNTVQGPFSSGDMERWFAAGYFTVLLPVKRMGETQFSTIQQLIKDLGRLPFRSDASSLTPPPPPLLVQPQQSIVPVPQKFNSMTYTAPSSANSAYLEDYLMQQQSIQNIQQPMLFNRQTSMPLSTTDRKPTASSSIIPPQLQAYYNSQKQQQQQLTPSLFTTNPANDPAVAYQQQPPQLQRSISATNNQQQTPTGLYDEMQRSFRQISSSSNPSTFFGTNLSMSQSQQPDDIMTRLAQAMQSHGQQQLEKVDEQRRLEQQRRELDLERIKLAQQAEQIRLQREDDERRRLEQQNRLDKELHKKQEATLKKQMLLEQMKEMSKAMDQTKAQQQPPSVVKPQTNVDMDSFLAFQQSVHFQKEQQAKIEAQKAENVRRYQQQLREQSHPSPPAQPQSTFKLPDTANWARHSSQSNEQSSQPLNFLEIQKQEQEQERRTREAAMAAQQLARSDALNIPNASSSLSSSSNKVGSWARTLFASGTVNMNAIPLTSDSDPNETMLPESPISSYNQQATNAVLSLLNIHPKSRSATQQQSAPWNTASLTTNTSLQDIQRQQQQQIQSDTKQQQQQQQQQLQQQQQANTIASAHASSSGPAWGGIFSSPQPPSSMFWGDDHTPTSPPSKSSATSGNKPLTPWTELKSATAPSSKSAPNNAELSKSEREAKYLFNTTRTQDALSKWTQTQFKDNLQAIDVPTLVQLLKDIDSSEEIVEYVQPYIGSITKAREFAHDFITKRKQLANVQPELDNERLNALAMAPTSSNSNSGHTGDEGFQLASSNGQKKKAKKMKGQKIDVKQLGFMVNNRPEQREDIDRVQM